MPSIRWEDSTISYIHVGAEKALEAPGFALISLPIFDVLQLNTELPIGGGRLQSGDIDSH